MHNDMLIKKKNRPPIVFIIWLAKETIKAYSVLTQDYWEEQKLKKQQQTKQTFPYSYIHRQHSQRTTLENK